MIVFKTVLRNSKRNIISILGISLAYVVSLIIIIYVNDQLSIDKSQSNYKKIYRLERGTWALLPGGVIPWVEEQYPEVVSHARIGGTYWESMIDYQNEFHTIERVLFVDGKPFDVFDYNFIYGDAETALDAPNAVVLTNELSRRIFGDENPMGKLLNYNDQFPVQVTAVIEERSDIHLRFDMLIKFEMLKDVLALKTDQFMTRLSGSQNYMGYMVLNTDDIDALVEKINSNLIEIGAYDTDNNPPNYIFRPFKNIYFSNDAVTEFGVVHGNFQTVIAMIFIALFILIIATINYVNVANAKGITRAREVGLRKLLGCSRKSLILQFISESVFISLISFILAILFILILYNSFQTAFGIQLPQLNSLTPVIYFIAIGILMFIPVTGGIYPALFLSSLKPGNLFSIDLKSAGRGLIIRRALILVQFVIAIFLTIQSAAIFKQYLFMKNKDLGIDMENIIQFEIPDYLSDKSDAIREALLDHNDIKSVSYIQQPLGNIRNTNTLTSPKNQERVPFKWIITDPEQFEVLRLKLLSGRTFTRNREADKSVSWIINETGARAMGFNPAEKITNYMWKAFGGEQEFEVIGVVKDYHFNSVNKAIEPLILRWSDGGNMAVFRYETDDLSTVLNHLEKTWNQFEQNRPINYSFLDEKFDKYYITEQRLGTLMTTFTLIALIIACFGVFGISAFMAQQMSRSISLRRVMGGETGSLVIKFTSEYFWLICVAGVVSIPLAYLYIGKWLSRFPYKTDISAWIFILGFLLNLLVVLLTVAYNAFRTVRKNPVEVLRYE